MIIVPLLFLFFRFGYDDMIYDFKIGNVFQMKMGVFCVKERQIIFSFV